MKTKEQQVAELFDKFSDLFEGDDSLPNTISRVKAMADQLGIIENLNLKQVVEEVDRLKAAQHTLTQQIRGSKGRFYVPGIEDEEFSMLKAFVAIKSGKWSGAEHEKEVLDAVRVKRQSVLRATAGAQNVGDDELGGYFVPDQVIPDVITAIYTKSVWINLTGEGTTRVSVLDGLIGGNVKIPKFDGGLIAYWIGEEDDYAESQVTLGDVTMNPKKLGILVRLTDAMRRFQSYGFETLLRNDMSRAAAKKLDWTIMYGRGTDDMPKGIVNYDIKYWRAETGEVLTRAEAEQVADWDGGTLDFDGMMDMELALTEDDIDLDASQTWISCPRFFKNLKQLKVANYTGQTDEKAYLLGAPFLSDAALTGIIGPYDWSNQIPTNNIPGQSPDFNSDSTTTKYSDVFTGNLSNIVLGRWSGIEVEDDAGKGVGFTSDHTYLKLRMYADVTIRQERSIIMCPDAQVVA